MKGGRDGHTDERVTAAQWEVVSVGHRGAAAAVRSRAVCVLTQTRDGLRTGTYRLGT
jgi:hypothetical protein